MERQYWSLFIILMIALIGLLGCFLFFLVMYIKRKLDIRFFIATIVIIAFACVYNVYHFIPLIQDLDMVRKHEYMEDIGTVVEFTEVSQISEGNGQIDYSKPLFYISEKDAYIILHLKNVQVGETYRIKYYPHSKIAEASLIE